MSLALSAAGKAEWKHHWKVVLASALGLAVTNVPMHSVGIFTNAIAEDLGWKRSVIASGVMIMAIAAVVFGPLVGVAMDRLGSRRIGIVGAPLVLASFALFSLTTHEQWTWWALWTLMAICYLPMLQLVWTGAIASLFNASRGLALATALAGTALASSILPLLGAYLIEEFGWRTAYVGIAIVFAVMALPFIFTYFTSAKDMARLRGETAQESARKTVVLEGLSGREAIMSWRYVRYALAATAMVAIPSVSTTIIPIARSFGHDPMTAAWLATLAAVAGFIGRFLGGYLLDLIDGNLVASGALFLPVIAITLMMQFPHSVVILAVAAVIIGLSIGAELDATVYLASRHFGLKAFGFILSVTGMGQFLGMAIGPVGLNYAFDVTGSYQPGLLVAIAVCLFGSAMFLTLGKYRYSAPGADSPVPGGH